MGRSQDGVPYPCVRIEAADVYLRLVQHVQKKGFSHFAFIGGPPDLINHIDRLKWYKAALKKCGVPLDPRWTIPTDMSSTGAYEAVRALLLRPAPPDALLCVNDQTAYGALHAAHERRLRVGRDIAIAGFDSLRDSLHTEPPLTTMGVPMSEMARQLVHMLLEKLNDRISAAREIVISVLRTPLNAATDLVQPDMQQLLKQQEELHKQRAAEKKDN